MSHFIVAIVFLIAGAVISYIFFPREKKVVEAVESGYAGAKSFAGKIKDEAKKL